MNKKTPNNAIFSKEILNKAWVVFLTIIILGAILRCFRLSFQSYWFDEILNMRNVAGNNFFRFLADGFSGDPPLYEFLLHFWIKIFGQGEISTRALSVIFSAATLPAMYLLARGLFDNKTAVYSTLLLSFSAYHIYYAQEARMYALTGFLVVSSSIFFVKALKSDKRINWAMYSIVTALAFYAHYSALFVVLAEYIVICLYWRKYRIKVCHLIGSLLAIAIMSLPWALISLIPQFIIPAFIEKNSYLWIAMPSPKAIFHTFIFFTWGQESVTTRNLWGCYWLLFYCLALIIITLMILTDLRSTFRHKEPFERRVATIFVVLWCFLPVAIIYLISILVKPIYVVRYVDVALFAFYILIAHALCRVRPAFLRTILLSVCLIPNIVALNYYYRLPVKYPMRDIAHFLKLKQAFNDKILVHVPAVLQAIGVLQYYYPEISEHMQEFTPRAVRDVVNEGGDFWLLVTIDDKQLIENLKRQDWIGSNFNNIYQQAEMKQIGAIKIIRFKTAAWRFNTIQKKK